MRVQDQLVQWFMPKAPPTTPQVSGFRGHHSATSTSGSKAHGTRPKEQVLWAGGDNYQEAYESTRRFDLSKQADEGPICGLFQRWRNGRRDRALDEAEQAVGAWDADRAINLTTKVLKSDPDSVRALHIRARAYEGTHLNIEAVRDLNRAIELTGASDGYLFGIRGHIKRSLADSYALADINKALLLLPSNADALADRADLKIMRGDYDGAIDDRRRVVQLRPGNEFALRLLANIVSAAEAPRKASRN